MGPFSEPRELATGPYASAPPSTGSPLLGHTEPQIGPMLCFFCSFCLLELLVSGVRSSSTCAGEVKSQGRGSQTTAFQAETGRTFRSGRLAQCGTALMGCVLFHWRLHHCGSNLSAANGRLGCYWSFTVINNTTVKILVHPSYVPLGWIPQERHHRAGGRQCRCFPPLGVLSRFPLTPHSPAADDRCPTRGLLPSTRRAVLC